MTRAQEVRSALMHQLGGGGWRTASAIHSSLPAFTKTSVSEGIRAMLDEGLAIRRGAGRAAEVRIAQRDGHL